MEIECTICGYLCDVEDDLPPRVCDDGEHKCVSCENSFKVCWTAEVELR